MKKIIYYIFALAFTINIIANLNSIISIKKNTAEALPKELSAETVTTKIKYIVKLSENHIYVYEDKSTKPLKQLNIDVSSLRKYDKENLIKGIEFDTLKEISQFEEDFSG